MNTMLGISLAVIGLSEDGFIGHPQCEHAELPTIQGNPSDDANLFLRYACASNLDCDIGVRIITRRNADVCWVISTVKRCGGNVSH